MKKQGGPLEFVSVEKVKVQGNPFVWIDGDHYRVTNRPLYDLTEQEILEELIYTPSYCYSIAYLPEESQVHGPYFIDSIRPSNFQKSDFEILTKEVHALYSENSTPQWREKSAKEIDHLLKKINSPHALVFKLNDNNLKKHTMSTTYNQFHEFIVINKKDDSVWVVIVGED